MGLGEGGLGSRGLSVGLWVRVRVRVTVGIRVRFRLEGHFCHRH